mmetsp:Transcript_1558/g.3983  ORF Transcript_1558/g.3983 Transcript_1558/m.3983 type:complete len:276 (+) Transcript_1558:1313-2140(+)
MGTLSPRRSGSFSEISRIASSRCRARCSAALSRCICARSRRFSIFRSKRVEKRVCGQSSTFTVPSSKTLGPCDDLGDNTSAIGRHAMPRVSVTSASRSLLSSRQSSRAQARRPMRFTRRSVSATPCSLMRTAASSSSPSPATRRSRSSHSRGSFSSAKIMVDVMRPRLRALRMPTMRVSLSRLMIRPTSAPKFASWSAILSSTSFTSAAQDAPTAKKAPTPATFSLSRYWRMVMWVFHVSSRFRSCPSLYEAIVFAISLRHARELRFAVAHCAVA